MTTLASIFAGGRITAAEVQAVAPLAAVKLADQQVTSSTTMINDSALLLPGLNASGVYLFGCFLDYEGGTQGSSDLKFTWSLPSASSTLRYQLTSNSTAGVVTNTIKNGSSVAAVGSNGAGVIQPAMMFGTLFVGPTSGSMQLQWAQNTSSATPTIVHAQSILFAWQVL